MPCHSRCSRSRLVIGRGCNHAMRAAKENNASSLEASSFEAGDSSSLSLDFWPFSSSSWDRDLTCDRWFWFLEIQLAACAGAAFWLRALPRSLPFGSSRHWVEGISWSTASQSTLGLDSVAEVLKFGCLLSSEERTRSRRARWNTIEEEPKVEGTRYRAPAGLTGLDWLLNRVRSKRLCINCWTKFRSNLRWKW